MQAEKNMYLDLLKNCLTASIYDESAWRIVKPTASRKLSMLKPWKYVGVLFMRLFLARAARRSRILVKRKPFDATARENGSDWPFFGYTMIGCRRMENIQACIEDVLKNDVPGDLIETGVWAGGATIFMRAVLKCHNVTDRTVWVADSFEGLPPPNTEAFGSDAGDDLSETQYLKVSQEDVAANFARFDLLDDQVKFLKGWFCDTLPDAPIEKLAILRLDGDLYESTMDALKALYHRVSPGGYVIVDDYFSWDSCKKAVTDFRTEHGIDAEIKKIDWTGVYWQVD